MECVFSFLFDYFHSKKTVATFFYYWVVYALVLVRHRSKCSMVVTHVPTPWYVDSVLIVTVSVSGTALFSSLKNAPRLSWVLFPL